MTRTTRRTYLGGLATVLTAGSASIAGCLGDGGDGGDTLPGGDFPPVDRWLTESDVGAPDDTYDGTILDRQDQSTVTIDVGAQGNGGNFAFGPSAVAVSTGTTVRWVWTGLGSTHNVEAEPDEQIGESDFEFGSGPAVSDEGTEFTQTFDESGIALYHCEPHLAVGMKGAVVVR